MSDRLTPFRVAVVAIILAGVALSIAGVGAAIPTAVVIALVLLFTGKQAGWRF